jgi:hypothetical protein
MDAHSLCTARSGIDFKCPLFQLTRLVAHGRPQPLHRQVRRQRAPHRLLVPLPLPHSDAKGASREIRILALGAREWLLDDGQI